MIIISIILLIIAIYLDGIIPIYSNYYLLSNLSIITVILIYPFFTKHKIIYITILIIGGIIYDLMYTNVLFLNSIIYFCIYLLLDKNFKKMNISIIFKYYFIYLLVLFSSFYIVKYTKDLFFLLRIFTSSIILNTVYILLIYLLFKDRYPTKKNYLLKE